MPDATPTQTVLPSLNAIIAQNAGTPAPAAQPAPVQAPVAPTVIVATGEPIPAAQPQAPVAAPAVPAQPQVQQQQPAQPSGIQPGQLQVLRDRLTSAGFNIGSDISDEQLAELVVNNLDQFYETQPKLTQYEQHQAEFQAWLASRQTQNQSPSQPAQLPGQQTAQSPAAQQQPASEPAPSIDPATLLRAVSAGMIAKGQDGKWAATNPAYGSFATAMNLQDAQATQARAALATNPEQFINQTVEAALQKQRQEFEKLLEKQRNELTLQVNVEQEKSQIQQWVQQNSARLYQGNQFSPYGQLYQTFEKQVDIDSPNLRPLERHQQVLEKLKPFEGMFPNGQQTPAQQPPLNVQPQQQSFIQAANNRNGQNRLSQYDGTAHNKIEPSIPRGQMGLPSLAGIIAAQQVQ